MITDIHYRYQLGGDIVRRSQMSREERESRSRLKPSISYGEFVRGTLTIRRRTCGNPNCKCATGKKHVSLYITRGKNGKIEQLYIPKDKEELARRWVKGYREIQNLLEKISSTYWDRLKRKD